MKRLLTVLCVLLLLSCSFCSGQFQPSEPVENEPVGERPYEMVNARRDTDIREALIDFENLENWGVETHGNDAKFRPSRRQQLWGDYVGHLEYRKSENAVDSGEVHTILRPAEPVAIPDAFDSMTVWVYGNNWDWVRPSVPPQVTLSALFQSDSDETVEIRLDRVRWKEWWLVHHKFQPDEKSRLGERPKFAGFKISGGTNEEWTSLFFDNIAFYVEDLKPLTFAPRPKRPLDYPEGQTVGTNTGPDVLPFPTREETILPGAMDDIIRTQLAVLEADAFRLDRFTTKGALADTQFQSSGVFQVFSGGSLDFGVPASEVVSEMLSADIINEGEDEFLQTVWKYTFRDKECLAKWTFRSWNNSLVIEVEARGGLVRAVNLGRIRPMDPEEQLVHFPVPYLTGNGGNRPLVTMIPENKEKDRPRLFFLATVDHTRSNGSELFFGAENHGVRYRPKTDGTCNDCFERIFVTVSPVFADVLPNIPNPESPWREVTASRVWYPHGATDREKDYQFWKRIHRYGIRNMIINDHETCWRDAGESFTFRTYAAPKKGGDEGQFEYTRKIHDLGYYYGPYNNYTDYAPVNAFWNEDWVTRLPDGQWRAAWARCYNPKPQIAVEAEQKIAEIVQEKFRFNTAYCDVHTAVTPWDYVDYDARVPGAGTFAATFYAYGEIMLHQKKTWGGPVYSEGNNHWYYCGLTDGNYAQDQHYFKRNSRDLPWLVDFDLLKMHPRGNHFGMGSPDMFFSAEEIKQPYMLDRFIAATLAFGHTGFLVPHGQTGAMKSYFLAQAIARRTGVQNVKQIRYGDENGNLLTTEEALETGAYKLNRIEVTYEDGLIVRVNGNRNEHWGELPPHGFTVDDPQSLLNVEAIDYRGGRFDFVESPEYLYADARGKLRQFNKVLCNGKLAVIKNQDSPWEVIPVTEGENPCTIFAVELPDHANAKAVALDFDRNELGPVKTRYSRSMVHITPQEGAFSYLLYPEEAPVKMKEAHQLYVVPGQMIQYDGMEYRIPKDAVHYSLHWGDTPEGKKHFIVTTLCDLRANFDNENGEFVFDVTRHLFEDAEYRFSILDGQGHEIAGRSMQELSGKLVFPGDVIDLSQPGTDKIEIRITAIVNDQKLVFSKPFWVHRELKTVEYPVSHAFEVGVILRDGTRGPADEKNGAYAYTQECTSGGVTKPGWAVHPPYKNGVGSTTMLSDEMTLPQTHATRFSAHVGIRDGGDSSDGITYKVIVAEELDGRIRETEVASVLHTARRWSEITADLSPWRGKTIRLCLVTDVGPHDDSGADWACWADLNLSSEDEIIVTTISETQ